MKKLFALLLAVALCAAMVLPAYADEPTPAPTGTITISNAEQGWTYYVVKAFDAQVKVITEGSSTTTNVSYSLDKSANAELYNLIKNDAIYEKPDKTKVENPFVLHETANPNVFNVTHKGDQSKELGRGWLYGLYGKEGGWNLAASDTMKLASDQYNTLTSKALPYGYYMIYKVNDATKQAGVIASVVTLEGDTATIADKNPRSPGDPDKKVKVGSGYEHTAEAQVGDVVAYQASFMATNYRTYDNMTTKQIKSYTFRDDAKGLKYKSLDHMAIYTTKDPETGAFSGLVEEWFWDEEHLPPYVPDATFGGYSMTVDWVDENGKSLYPSPCYIVLDYQMYVTELALNNIYNNTAINTFSPSFTMDGDPVPVENPPSVKVYTTGLSLTKTDGSNHPLTGAEFILSKVEGTTEKFYHVVDRKSDVTEETWKDVEWVAKAEADEVLVTNSPDTQTFGGLTSGTYRLYEVKTPDGFKFPGFEYWEIVISYNKDAANPFSATIRPSNVGADKATDLSLYTSGTTTRNYFTATIVNEGGSPLPQTGAEGTTMLLLVGGTMFAVTMLFLVTKKRLYNEG